jgi:hypothetical protein
MMMLIPDLPDRPAPRPHHRLVVPDPPEPWTLEDVDFLLWPNSPEHLPVDLQEQEQEEDWHEQTLLRQRGL